MELAAVADTVGVEMTSFSASGQASSRTNASTGLPFGYCMLDDDDQEENCRTKWDDIRTSAPH